MDIKYKKELLGLINTGISLISSVNDKDPILELRDSRAYTLALFYQIQEIHFLFKHATETDNLSMLADMARKLFEISKRLQILHCSDQVGINISIYDMRLHDAKKALKDFKKIEEHESSDRAKAFVNGMNDTIYFLKENGGSSNRYDKAEKKWEEQFHEKQFEIYTILCDFVHGNFNGIVNLYIRNTNNGAQIITESDKDTLYWLLYFISSGMIFTHSSYVLVFGENDCSDKFLAKGISILQKLEKHNFRDS